MKWSEIKLNFFQYVKNIDIIEILKWLNYV